MVVFERVRMVSVMSVFQAEGGVLMDAAKKEIKLYLKMILISTKSTLVLLTKFINLPGY